MRALTASSKLSGCSDTGLAFGMVPPRKASGTARLYPSAIWLCLSSEDAASESSSASCYDFGEDIRVLPVVVPKLKLRKIEREIFFAYVMVVANNSALEQGPETLDGVSVHDAAHVFFLAVVNRFMREADFIESGVSRRFICRYHGNISLTASMTNF
jgi:hypothetical protein